MFIEQLLWNFYNIVIEGEKVMISFYDYNVLSVLYEDDDFKIARVCKSNSDEKVILKIVRKKVVL